MSFHLADRSDAASVAPPLPDGCAAALPPCDVIAHIDTELAQILQRSGWSQWRSLPNERARPRFLCAGPLHGTWGRTGRTVSAVIEPVFLSCAAFDRTAQVHCARDREAQQHSVRPVRPVRPSLVRGSNAPML